jgi:hypothetical protein
MPGWDWLTKAEYNWRFVRNVWIKATVLFVLINIGFALVQPLDLIGKVSIYNTLVPGRERLPYADNPEDAYNLTLANLEAMFAAHILSAAPRSDDTFRVGIVGDSGVWGWLLDNDETFNACINAQGAQMDDGRAIVAYNLGLPSTNVTKDLLLIDAALEHNLDAIVWMTTLEGIYRDDQLDHPVVADNAPRVRELIAQYDLPLDAALLPPEKNFLDHTLVGQRRALSDWLRLQVYGVAWSNTQIDHVNPLFFRSPIANLPDSIGISNRDYLQPGIDLAQYLALDVLDAGLAHADLPIVIVNEPIFISDGLNSDLRYNELYPRWIYDEYRALLAARATANNWIYLDIWDAVPLANFTDFPLHYDAEWTCRVADLMLPSIRSLAD